MKNFLIGITQMEQEKKRKRREKNFQDYLIDPWEKYLNDASIDKLKSVKNYKKILEDKYDKKVTDLYLVCLHPDKKNYEKIKVADLQKDIEELFNEFLKFCRVNNENYIKMTKKEDFFRKVLLNKKKNKFLKKNNRRFNNVNNKKLYFKNMRMSINELDIKHEQIHLPYQGSEPSYTSGG